MIKIILVPTERKQTIQYIEQSVNNVILLKTYVSSIKIIFQALATAQSDLLLTIREVGAHLIASSRCQLTKFSCVLRKAIGPLKSSLIQH